MYHQNTTYRFVFTLLCVTSLVRLNLPKGMEDENKTGESYPVHLKQDESQVALHQLGSMQ